MTTVPITCTINGTPQTLRVSPMRRLLDMLREDAHLTGTKEGCGEGECGACAILLNGELVNSCLVPALQADGATIVTVEGIAAQRLADGRAADVVQAALATCGGTQCGICTPGFVVAITALLQTNSRPTTAEIRTALGGNLCRCTGYMKIVAAVAQCVHAAEGTA
ncbi:MAG: (2Fe-2S)-binding protein [Deltaproteobacteria bacterium]|nr:(2Fe-2S)-binding protein [Deltaproteobacteria bacterium]